MPLQYTEKTSANFPKRKKKRMSSDLVIGLVGIVVVVAILVMGMNHFIANWKANRTLEQEADQYLSYLTRSLRLPLWSMDDDTIRQIGDAYMASDRFSLLEIVSNEYEENYVYLKKKAGDEEMVLRDAQIFHGGQVVGSIRLGLTKTPYKNELARQLNSSLWIVAAIVLAMVTTIFFMLRIFVRHPLQLLMDVAGDMARGDYDGRKANFKHYEIAMVYDQLITMAARVKGREASLEEANVKLREEIRRRENSERELRGLRNYLSSIIDSMPSLLIGVDSDGCITQWNKTVEYNTGITAHTAQGKKITEVLPWMAPEMAKISESITSREIIRNQRIPRVQGDSTRYEDMTIFPLIADGIEGAVIRVDDITDWVRMEEMMVQSEKMLSVGGLAAGMAHEINNPLAGIMQTANVLRDRIGNPQVPANLKAAEAAGTTMDNIGSFMQARGIPRMIDAINESGQRVAAVVNNMLSFARKSDSTVSTQSLENLLDKTLVLATADYDLKKHYDFKLIKIHKEYAGDLPPVPCESTKIQQVLLNIFRNGAQAMQTAGTDDPGFLIRTRFEPDRGMAVMEIEDNGPGMGASVRKRVFEPFFTTKPPGVGTGLGLSVSYFIITENHSGEMSVASSPGNGAVFTIRLPVNRRNHG